MKYLYSKENEKVCLDDNLLRFYGSITKDTLKVG